MTDWSSTRHDAVPAVVLELHYYNMCACVWPQYPQNQTWLDVAMLSTTHHAR